MLARAGFRDNARLAHSDGEQDLPDAIVDLVRAGVIQLVALEPDLRAAHGFGQPLGEIERAGPPDIMFEQVVELRLKGGIGLRGAIFALQIEHQRHQRLGDVAPAVIAEMAAFVGHVTHAVGESGGLVRLRSLFGHRHSDWQRVRSMSTGFTCGCRPKQRRR